MTAKEYLSRAHRLNDKINALLVELERYKELSCSISSPQLGERIQTSRNADPPFVRALIKIDETQRKINAAIDSLVDVKLDITERIGRMENADEQTLLHYRYLDEISWNDIALKMNVSLRTIYRLHGSALQHFPMD